MKPLIALGLAMAGGVIAYRSLPQAKRSHLTEAGRHRMAKRFEHMLASLPESALPKLIMSILPRLQAQNDQIIAMLGEQNKLLREARAKRTLPEISAN